MSLLNVPSNLKNSIDDLQLYGTLIANKHANAEVMRLCKLGNVLFLGRVLIDTAGRNAQSPAWFNIFSSSSQQQCLSKARNYHQETYVVTMISKLFEKSGHANMLFGCPCTGTYMMFDPWGANAAENSPAYQKAVEQYASALHDIVKSSFLPIPALSFVGLLTACPYRGPQVKEAVLYRDVQVNETQRSPGLCLIWTLFLLRCLFLSTKPITQDEFVKIQTDLSKTVAVRGKGLAQLAAYCQDLIVVHGMPSNAEVHAFYKTVPKRINKEQKAWLVPRHDDPFDLDTTMTRAKKALRSYDGPTIPVDFQTSVQGRVYDMRKILLDWCAYKTDAGAQMYWSPGAVKVGGSFLNPFGTAIPPEELQRITWTLACSALDLLPVPGVMFTMTDHTAHQNACFDVTSSSTNAFITNLLSNCLIRKFSNMYTASEYATSRKLIQARWEAKQLQFREMFAKWQQREADPGVFVASGLVAAGGVGLAVAAAMMSGGLLLPVIVSMGGGVISGAAGGTTAYVLNKRVAPEPVRQSSSNYLKEVEANKTKLRAVGDNLLYVYMKTVIHALLLVLNIRLARLPGVLKKKLDFNSRIEQAVINDKRDRRLSYMFQHLQDSQTALALMSNAQLGCTATALCKLILFPTLPPLFPETLRQLAESKAK